MKLSEYVSQVINDPKYGHDIGWVKDNLNRAHIEQIEAAHDAEVRAGVVAEEPEWEYGIRAEGDDEPYTDHSDDPDWLCDQTTPEPGDAIVRRRKAGPWVPAKQEGETND